MSSSYRYTESPTFNQRIDIPIHHLSNNKIHPKDTTIQWINDSINGSEKFQMKINIEGFNQNEVIIFLRYLIFVFISSIASLG
jgi:hypothetical protein